jgi:uncharacterized MnhB-related membrane protein
MVTIGLVIAALFCALQVMRAQRLMLSTIWLALTSALVAVLLYRAGAPEVAVIELSVGAGLVTVLFVFAFSIVGEVTLDPITIIPRLLVWCVILSVSFILGSLTLPVEYLGGKMETATFGVLLWEQRGLDVLAQIVLIFAGVIGVVGLLSESSREGEMSGREAVAIEAQVISPNPQPELAVEPSVEPEREFEEVPA